MSNNIANKIEINQENYEQILEIARESYSKTDLCTRLGWKNNSKKIDILTSLLLINNFSNSDFKKRTKESRSIFKDKEKLISVVKESYSYTQVIRAYTPKVSAGLYLSLKVYLKKYEIDISHFNISKSLNKENFRFYKNENLFIRDSTASTNTVKQRILKDHLIEYKCSNKGCGNTGEWLGKKLVLQLEHINGIRTDNRLQNLTWLCPNCHSMTDTFCSKNKKKLNSTSKFLKEDEKRLSLIWKIEEDKENFLKKAIKDCNGYQDILKKYQIHTGWEYVQQLKEFLDKNKTPEVEDFLKRIAKKSDNFPPVKTVIAMLRNKSFVQVGKELGCSDNGVRKYLIKHGIDVKGIRRI